MHLPLARSPTVYSNKAIVSCLNNYWSNYMSLGYLIVCALRGCLKRFGPLSILNMKIYPWKIKAGTKTSRKKQQQNLPKVVYSCFIGNQLLGSS